MGDDNSVREVNIVLENTIVSRLISEKGKQIAFPKHGIPGQTKEAKDSKINATIGIMLEDDKKPTHLTSYSENVNLEPEKIFPYAPNYGVLELREKWKENILRKNPSIKKEFSLPVTTAGLTHGLSIAGQLFVNPGDEIFVPEKTWENYVLIFEKMLGAKLKKYNDIENISNKKIILLFTYPNNPTGYMPTEKEVDELVSQIKKQAENAPVLVILDDAYFGFNYEENNFKESLFSRLYNAHRNILTVKIDGGSKEEFIWGLRVGFITFGSKNLTKKEYVALESKAAGVVRATVSNVSILSQNLLLESLKSDNRENEIKKKKEMMKKRYEAVKKVLKTEKYKEYFEPIPFNSGYFLCLKLKKNNTEEVRNLLIKKYGTGTINADGLLRIAYSSVPEKDIPELFENIYRACKENEKILDAK